MANRIESTIKQFEVPGQDLPRLAVGVFGLQPHARSPLGPACQAPDARTAPSGASIQAFGQDNELRQALAILANPDHQMTLRIGGGAMGLEEAWLCHANAHGTCLAFCGKTETGDWLVILHSDPAAFCAWWMEKYGGRNADTIPNAIPPNTGMGEFLVTLHAIDAFRRVSFQNMLDYVVTDRPAISLKLFVDTLSRSVKAMDTRWLLPSFLLLTPGIELYRADFVEKDIDVLIRLGLFTQAMNEKTGEDMLVFSENLRAMGVAFYRSWMFSAGFEILSVSSTGRTSYGSFFVAPTALANHFVRLEHDGDGKPLANHQTYTARQLESQLDALLEEMMRLPAPIPDAAGPAAEAVKVIYCAQCGKPLTSKDRFCDACGAPVQ